MEVVGGGGEDGKFGGGIAGARRVPEDASHGDSAGAGRLFMLGRQDGRSRLPMAVDQDPLQREAYSRNDRLLRELSQFRIRNLSQRGALQL